jgi:hypothetical protein
VTVFGFIAAKRAEHSVKTMCRVLEVSRSGFHAWAKRTPSARAVEDERLLERIREIYELNRRVYGSPRVHAERVIADGEKIGRKRVERLMRQAGISGLFARRRGKTTVRVPGVRVCDDLVDRAFLAAAPDRLWVADITYLRTWEGWLYLVAAPSALAGREGITAGLLAVSAVARPNGPGSPPSRMWTIRRAAAAGGVSSSAIQAGAAIRATVPGDTHRRHCSGSDTS